MLGRREVRFARAKIGEIDPLSAVAFRCRQHGGSRRDRNAVHTVRKLHGTRLLFMAGGPLPPPPGGAPKNRGPHPQELRTWSPRRGLTPHSTHTARGRPERRPSLA